jgi:DHA1 family multidrug resistance protein-like MFS transporter
LTLTMAADSAPKGRMAQAIGTVQTAQRLGPALGPVFGGVIAAVVGLRHAFQCAAVCYLVAVLLVFVMYHEPVRQAQEGGGSATRATVTFRNVLAFENFLLMMAVIFSLQFVDRSFGPILPLYVGQFGIATERIPLISGMLFSIAAGAGAVGHHYCAALMRRRSATGVITLACAVAAAGAAVIVVARDARWLFAGAPLFGVAIGAGMTAAYTAAGTVIPASARGAGFGLLTTASLIGLALSPVVSGFLGATSIRAVFVLDVVGLAVLAIVVRQVGRQEGSKPSTRTKDEPPITDEPLLSETV